jgi:hypothetical protein
MARLGALLSLNGLGTAFDGNVRIVAIHHSMVSGSWTTRIDFRSTDLDAGNRA